MEKKLQRNDQKKMLAGVCSGLADYLNADITIIRIAFIIAAIAGFSGVLAYITLWVIMPVKPLKYLSENTANYSGYANAKI